MTDDQAQKPTDDEDYDGPMKFNWDKAKPNPYVKKPEAKPREWWIGQHGRTTYAYKNPDIAPVESVHVIEKSYADALARKVAELEERNTALYLGIRAERDAIAKERLAEALRESYAKSGDFLEREQRLVSLLDRIASACGAPDAAEACRNILALIKANKGGA